MTHYRNKASQDDIDKVWQRSWKDRTHNAMALRADVKMEIEYQGRFEEEVVMGTVTQFGLNSVKVDLEDGREAFFIPKGDADRTTHVLFNDTYRDDSEYVPRYKYEINEVRFNVDYISDPTCPTCGKEMVYGHADWNEYGSTTEGYFQGWLCPKEFPYDFTEGIE